VNSLPAEASPQWQGVIFLCSAVFILWEFWRGWRAGVVRSGINLVALFLSGVLGLLAGQTAASVFGGTNGLAGLFVGLGVGSVTAMVVFVLIWFLSSVLFKRTDHQAGGLLKFFWGLGGGFFGLLTALMILWSGISMIRAMGTLAEAQTEVAREKSRQVSKLATGMVTLKESLELGPTGEFIESIDVMPDDVYTLIRDVSVLSSDETSMVRFSEYPGIQDIMAHPKMIELLNDPDIVQAAQNKNFLAIVGNKNLRAALEDPTLVEQLQKIDLRAALNFAMKKASPKPSPTPSHLP